MPGNTASNRAHGRLRASSPWLILTVVLLACMAGTINYYKVPPLLPVLMDTFHLAGGKAGFLMSVFAVVGIAFSIPAGFILNKLGYRSAGLLGIGWIAAGAGLGALSTSATGLLLTRLMEGVGLNLMAIVSPSVIASRFSGRQRAIAVGIWNAWYPLGSTITFIAAPFLSSLWGWRSVWWFGFLYAVAVGPLYLASVRSNPLPDAAVAKGPGEEAAQGHGPQGAASSPGTRLTLLNRDVWKLAVMFLSFAFLYVSYLTWTPAFLHRVRGVPIMQAAFIMSLFSVLSLVSSPASGWVLGRLRSSALMSACVMAVFTTLAVSISLVRVSFVFPIVIVMGVIGSFLPAAAVAGAAQLVHEKKASTLALAMVTTGQNVGILLGPTLFGWVMETTGAWGASYMTFVPAGLLGVGAALLLGRKKERITKHSVL